MRDEWREYFKSKRIETSERKRGILQTARKRAEKCIADLNLIVEGMGKIALTETEKREQYAKIFTNNEAQRLMANVFTAFSKGNQVKGNLWKNKTQETAKDIDFRELYY
ncbi:MAG: hypothetical protein U9O89_04945 [Thermoproteota archaeon]|nr:hypothetical protein [Thermoproteota archaeon]